ncbi:hypothetical protein [Curtobacterium sp. MCSS17_006]|uniref:hypothetical protein n=1 Tax=Curtobacterium sp. MCSS17_006 TaxID=2175642 RepID=UPI0021ACA3E9|nr:hypothetical protein [Curtobacterium sp. MCSS17_006]
MLVRYDAMVFGAIFFEWMCANQYRIHDVSVCDAVGMSPMSARSFCSRFNSATTTAFDLLRTNFRRRFPSIDGSSRTACQYFNGFVGSFGTRNRAPSPAPR